MLFIPIDWDSLQVTVLERIIVYVSQGGVGGGMPAPCDYWQSGMPLTSIPAFHFLKWSMTPRPPARQYFIRGDTALVNMLDRHPAKQLHPQPAVV